ncbi:MAG: HEPN domain-containing protein, partial [Nitrospirota bacterium]|nr:HEPN domain-containing protein [Nitrospirota bacterium]
MRSYLRKASDRLDILDLLLRKEAYSDVVREAQEIVELALKGMLRAIGIEPPKLHDVGGLLLKLGLFMNAVAKRLRPKSRRGFSQVRATQAYLRSV